MRKRKIDVKFTCSDYCYHEHRTKIGAFVCGKLQLVKAKYWKWRYDSAIKTIEKHLAREYIHKIENDILYGKCGNPNTVRTSLPIGIIRN